MRKLAYRFETNIYNIQCMYTLMYTHMCTHTQFPDDERVVFIFCWLFPPDVSCDNENFICFLLCDLGPFY